MLNLKPIGVFESTQIKSYQAGRQPDALGTFGKINLYQGENFEQALQDLDGCSHIWLIFGFHQNKNWKPLVQTPRSDRKIGVFATRAPYRPNPIGLSLVRLISVDGLMISVAENDLLDGSPIYDIKPFHPEADIATDPQVAWLEDSIVQKFKISFSPVADDQLDFLEAYLPGEIRPFIQRQLEYDPTNKNKKRVIEESGYWVLSYRTWRIDFTLTDDTAAILSIRSGYTPDQLTADDDAYNDKSLHRLFIKQF